MVQDVSRPTGILTQLEQERSVVVHGEMYDLLEQLCGKMRHASKVSEVVQTALELLLKAEGKEVVLMERGRVVARYNLWNQ
ncbi:MAG: hypothetical protein SXV54_03215 [Chloroflexota bacterium]|nr:hypothetical protein [Chloroflexota bacterium]